MHLLLRTVTRILVIIRRISRNHFKCNYLKNQTIFLEIWLRFWNLHELSKILKKRWAWQLKYLRYYWLRKTRFLKYLKGSVWEPPAAVNMLTSPKHFWNLHESKLFVNTLTTNDKYSRFYSEDFAQPIQMQLSKKTKIFFLKISLRFWNLSFF